MPKSWADRLPAARRSHEIVNMAAQRADELADEGDADGAGAWRRIIEAIDELRSMDGGRARALLDLRHRHLSGGYLEKDDQATFARPVRGPVLENYGVERNAVDRGFRRTSGAKESARADGAL
jgi:hypothetical protein